MIASWLPVILIDIIGSGLTLIIAVYCALLARQWTSNKTDDTFRNYVFLLTLAIVLFAVSRSFGHLVKQFLLLNQQEEIWNLIAPFSGAVNTVTFVVIFAFGIYFNRFRRVHLEIEKYKNNLEQLVEARTSQLESTNTALREQEEQVRLLLNSTAEGIYGVDMEGICTFCNPSCLRMLGYEREEELLGKSTHEMFHHTRPDGIPSPSSECPIYRAFTTGQGVHLTSEVFWRSDGGGLHVECRSHPIRKNGKVTGAVITFTDITERMRMEEELRRSQKLESLGILAGGIAHDFNNLLQVIIGNISLVQLRIGDSKPAADHLQETQKAAMRARELTQQLLTFSKGGAPILTSVSLPALISDSAGFALRGSNCAKDLSFAEDLRPVNADAGQLSQVFNNLFINAAQAMPEGGVIRVRGDNRTVTGEEPLDLAPGKYVRITVADEGIGIPQERISEIFDPYFSTKEGGSGLGLAVTYSIINNHQGAISVESSPGDGTTFTIFLPAAGDATPEKTAEDTPLEKGSGRILVMDDEENVREVVRQMLIHLGYEPELAAEGREAVAMYEKALDSGRPFDAVIMDLTIPGGMGGRKAVQELREIDPEVRAVVSSGFSNDPIMADYRDYGFVAVVPKPYKASDLRETLRRVLNA